MFSKLKKIKFTKKGVYISLAICMLLIGGVGIFSAIRNMNKIVDETDFVFDEANNIDSSPVTNFLDSLKQNESIEPAINEEIPVVLNFSMPVDGEILKEHSGKELVYSETMNDYRTHNGIDIITEDGASVVCSESGKITAIDDHPLWGMSVTVEHDNGYRTCYRNLSEILPEGIEIGSYISAGGVIGTIGSTALVEIGETPHLHFEMSLDGVAVNPLEYLV